MPPKPNRPNRPQPIRPNHGLINQYPIVLPSQEINNNDATKYDEAVSKDLLNPCNNNCWNNNQLIICGVIFTTLILFFRK